MISGWHKCYINFVRVGTGIAPWWHRHCIVRVAQIIHSVRVAYTLHNCMVVSIGTGITLCRDGIGIALHKYYIV